MKKLTIAFFVSISFGVLSQTSDYSIKLKDGESFEKILYKQIVDSVNMNQTGKEHFQYFEINLTPDEFTQADSFMKNCKSIQLIINKYGSPEFNYIFGEEGQPISGFYYSIENIKRINDSKLRICVIYPR